MKVKGFSLCSVVEIAASFCLRSRRAIGVAFLILEFQQLPRLQVEGLRDEREIPQAYLNLASLHLCQVTAVNPQSLRHLKLRPAVFLPESADSPA
jgi:hypothetical protein